MGVLKGDCLSRLGEGSLRKKGTDGEKGLVGVSCKVPTEPWRSPETFTFVMW